MLYQDIPRIYTAIAEWGSCLVYLYMLKREKMKSVHFLIGVLLMLALQSIFLTATGSVSEVLWIPCMIIAVAIMYVFLMVGGSMKPLGAAIAVPEHLCWQSLLLLCSGRLYLLYRREEFRVSGLKF